MLVTTDIPSTLYSELDPSPSPYPTTTSTTKQIRALRSKPSAKSEFSHPQNNEDNEAFNISTQDFESKFVFDAFSPPDLATATKSTGSVAKGSDELFTIKRPWETYADSDVSPTSVRSSWSKELSDSLASLSSSSSSSSRTSSVVLGMGFSEPMSRSSTTNASVSTLAHSIGSGLASAEDATKPRLALSPLRSHHGMKQELESESGGVDWKLPDLPLSLDWPLSLSPLQSPSDMLNSEGQLHTTNAGSSTMSDESAPPTAVLEPPARSPLRPSIPQRSSLRPRLSLSAHSPFQSQRDAAAAAAAPIAPSRSFSLSHSSHLPDHQRLDQRLKHEELMPLPLTMTRSRLQSVSDPATLQPRRSIASSPFTCLKGAHHPLCSGLCDRLDAVDSASASASAGDRARTMGSETSSSDWHDVDTVRKTPASSRLQRRRQSTPLVATSYAENGGRSREGAVRRSLTMLGPTTTVPALSTSKSIFSTSTPSPYQSSTSASIGSISTSQTIQPALTQPPPSPPSNRTSRMSLTLRRGSAEMTTTTSSDGRTNSTSMSTHTNMSMSMKRRASVMITGRMRSLIA